MRGVRRRNVSPGDGVLVKVREGEGEREKGGKRRRQGSEDEGFVFLHIGVKAREMREEDI